MVTVTGRSIILSIILRQKMYIERIWHWSPSCPFLDQLSIASVGANGHNIKTVGLPSRKVTSFLQPVKDDLSLKTLGIYNIPCECGKVYIGQSRCFIETRTKEYQWHMKLYHLEKSALTEHK